jgi:hypothetical protein
MGRVIVLDGVERTDDAQTFPHEVVHLLQFDFFKIAWGQPLENELRSQVFRGRRPLNWLHGGFVVPMMLSLELTISRDGYLLSLAQYEAEWLEKHCC